MIYVLGGGGGSAYAFIIATYPEGSVITCTNSVGKRKLANDKIIFYVKKPRNGEAQTCILSCTDGTHASTKTITIDYEGQSVSVLLGYEYILFENGILNPDLGLLKICYDKQGGTTWNIKNNQLYLESGGSLSARGVAYGGFTNAIVIDENRRYLCCTFVEAPSGNNSHVGISSSNGEGTSLYISPGGAGTVCLDLVNNYGNKYIKLYSWGESRVRVSKLWMQDHRL